MRPRRLIKHHELFRLVCFLLWCALPVGAQETADLEPFKNVTRSWRITNVAAIDLAISAANETERARVWQMTGPFGGDAKALAIDPRNSDRVLLGTNDGQLFRTNDGGQIWRRLRPGIKAPGFAVTVIFFDRERAGTIFVGVRQVKDAKDDATGGGLFMTTDNGESWREISALRERAVLGFVQAPKDPDILVTVARDGVYRSLNHGDSWERITPENDRELTGFHSAAIDPRDSNTIFVGTWHLPWKTTDGGQSWKLTGMKDTGVIDDSDIFSIKIEEENPDSLWMCACSGIYRSTDGSANWTKIKGIPYSARRTQVIYQHPTLPDVVFAGTIEGLWRSVKGGAPDTWRQVTSKLVINAIAIHPDKPERVFIATENYGVLISNDGGENYEMSNAGFISRYVKTVVADRTERGRIYAGVLFDDANGGFFISEDGGITWKQSVEGMDVRDVYSIHQSATAPDTLYAGTNHGIFRSDDRGRTWLPLKKLDPQAEEHAQQTASLTGPEPSNTVTQGRKPPAKPALKPTAKAAPPTAKADSKKAASSTVRNKKPATVKQVKKVAPPSEAPVSEFVDVQNQVYLLAPLNLAPTAAPPALPAAGTESNEAPGSAVTGDNNAPPAASAPAQPTDGFVAATWDGLFRSADEKKGWKALKLPNGVATADVVDTTAATPRAILTALATSPHVAGLILLGTETGLFVSRDNGDSFAPMPVTEKPQRIRSIVFDPRTAETIYVGTTEGFFRSFDGGRTWEQRGGGMPMLVEVSAIVINPLNPDELYLGDHLRGAFFHSLDRGKNWEGLDISALPSLRLLNLTADPFNPNRLYVGSYSGGVYVMSRQ